MPCSHLQNRVTALVDASSKERLPNLLRVIQQLRSEMNARGMLHSSIYVNEVCNACDSELRERAKGIWESIKRAHASCGSGTGEDLSTIFCTLLHAEKAKLEQTQEEAAGGVAQHLQNKSLIEFHLISETYDNLLTQYKTEIAMYLDNLKHGAGKHVLERLQSSLLNNKLVAVGALIIIAIVGLGSFTDAIDKLSGFMGRALGNLR